MGRNLSRHASLSLYNHFDNHEAQYHIQYSITILIYCHIDMYRRSILCAMHARACVCMWIHLCVYAQVSPRVCQDTPQE